jgi:hypothetical protein
MEAGAGPASAPAAADTGAVTNAAPDSAAANPCRLPPVLPVAPAVRDPVFAVLLGMVEENGCGVLTRERLEYEVRRLGRPTRLPIEYFRTLSRSPADSTSRSVVTLVSTQRLDVPVPYRILVYQPGRIRASGVILLEEWDLGTVTLDGDGRFTPARLDDVRLWGLRKGDVDLDVDGWLDRMLGSRLDDTRILGFALFRYEGRLIGMAMGYNREGKGRSGTFSFLTDRILFPNPDPLKAAGAYLRGRLERLMPEAAARCRG